MGRWSAQHRKLAIWGWLVFVFVSALAGGAVGTKTLDNAQRGVGDSGRADRTVEAAFPKNADKMVLVQSSAATVNDQLYLVDAELAVDLAAQAVERAEREAEKAAKEKAKDAGVEVDAGAPASEQLREAERAERRKKREAAKGEAQRAEAFNAELGVALVKRRGAQSRKAHRLNRAKVLGRRVIADNGDLAGAGLRLVMPQLREVEQATLKDGSQRNKVTYKDAEECRQYLLDSIERAKTVDEVLEVITDALIAAALADERELPRSRRIHWHAGVGNDPAELLAGEIKEVKPKRGKKRS